MFVLKIWFQLVNANKEVCMTPLYAGTSFFLNLLREKRQRCYKEWINMQGIFTAVYWPLSGDTSLFYCLNSSICNTQNQDKEVIWIEHPAGILSYWRYHGVLFYSNNSIQISLIMHQRETEWGQFSSVRNFKGQ